MEGEGEYGEEKEGGGEEVRKAGEQGRPSPGDFREVRGRTEKTTSRPEGSEGSGKEENEGSSQ